jgi:hypothetical protein
MPLAPYIVVLKNFAMLFVPNSEIESLCKEKMREAGAKVRITVNPGMFRK